MRQASRRVQAKLGILLAALVLAGCADGAASTESVGVSQAAITSALGTLLAFEFDGEVVSELAGSSAENGIDEQLLYTIGQLNGSGGVSSPATATLSRIASAPWGGGLSRTTYHARLAVAWPSQSDLPATYALILPLRVDGGGEALLQATSSASCFDTLAESDIWYDYRPDNPGCQLLVATSRPVATVTASDEGGVDEYPEYPKVWEDSSLDVVAVFRKDEAGATSAGDLGRVAYVAFVSSMYQRLGAGTVVTTASGGVPPLESDSAWLATDVTLSKTFADGRTVNVVTLLEDVVDAPSDLSLMGGYFAFLRRFAELTPTADLVLYNGHSGLGENLRSLAAHSSFLPGKYQIFYLDACDSFAYAGDELARARAAVNPDDPLGTKYMDVFVNAMPATFAGMPAAAMAIVEAMLPGAPPETYAEILAQFDGGRLGFVEGDEDNSHALVRSRPRHPVFQARGQAPSGQALGYATRTLEPGEYAFELSADWSRGDRGGDLALFARAGAAPGALAGFRCDAPSSPLAQGSARCRLTLGSPSKVYLSILGEERTPFSLVGFALGR